MAIILIDKETKRVKYGIISGNISLLRDVCVVEPDNDISYVVSDYKASTAEVIEGVTLPEGFTGDKFDYVNGEFVAVPEPEPEPISMFEGDGDAA